ncbi:hypothetical protein PR003_g30055 [Phytophthora rubi]|uniref:Secreted protein n=1 Tax=Phytophthora rubi TaxID=129364 RepID=A0A6A4BCU2_9STRA|nr:hypothetical protein PR002_g28519 [Phytophthora rubi]KAE9272928.1 hypothetical protein PR003_g30055 [Phytophthora rubi]
MWPASFAIVAVVFCRLSRSSSRLCVSCEITGVSKTKPVICDCLQTIVFHGRSHFNCATRTKLRLRTE